jgi:hypothetical protein
VLGAVATGAVVVATHIIVAPTYRYEPETPPVKQYEPSVGVIPVLGAVATGAVDHAVDVVVAIQTIEAPTYW